MHRLKELRKNSNLTQEELSQQLGLPLGAYKNYENNLCRLNDQILLKLSNFYNVSIDYLLKNDIDGKVVYSEEQRQIFKMVTQLNDINTLKAYSYVAGLLAGQG